MRFIIIFKICVSATAMHFNFGCVEACEGEVCAGMILSNVIRHQVEHFLRFKLANRRGLSRPFKTKVHLFVHWVKVKQLSFCRIAVELILRRF